MSYFVVPNADIPPNGLLQLGSVLASPSDACSVVNTEGPVPIPHDEVFRSHLTDYRESRKNEDDQPHSVWASFLQTMGMGRDSAKTTNFNLECGLLETIFFQPSLEYLKQTLSSQSVKAFLQEKWFKKPVYIVTGLKVAKDARLLKEYRSKHGGSVGGVDYTSPGVPVGIGPLSAGWESQSTKMMFGSSSDFVFAFSVKKIKVKQYRHGAYGNIPEEMSQQNEWNQWR